MISAYALAFAGLLLLGRRAADLLGRRRLFMVGLLLFTLGAAIMTPTARSIIAANPEEEASATGRSRPGACSAPSAPPRGI